MRKIASVRADDDKQGEIIYLGIENGRVIASNGDDVSYCEPQSEEKCRQDIIAQWGRWETFRYLG